VTQRRRFGLDRLMTRSRIREEQAQQGVAESVRGQGAAEDAYLIELERFRVAKAAARQPDNANDFRRSQEMAALQARAVLSADAERQKAETAMQDAHHEWLAAAREKRTYDRLDERDRIALAITASKAAQRTLDDLSSRRKRP
jgi:flagellar export protein FliJ